MAQKYPIRLNYDAENNPEGFAEFQSADYIGLSDGGTGGSYSSLADLRTGLGLEIGSDIQAYDADLSAIAALTHIDGGFIVSNGTTWVVESGSTARDSLSLGTGDDVTFATLTTTGSVTIQGNLDVQGEFLNTTAEIVVVDDAFVKLNNGNGEVDSGIIVETSDTDDARLFYDVSNNRWVLGENGSYDEILTQDSTDTLTNKSIDGSTNTLTNIPNSAFSNSSITVTDGTNSTDIALGGTITFSDGTGITVSESSGTITASVDFTEFDTDNVTEGSTNLYYTDARVSTYLTGGTGITESSGTISIDFTEFDTDNVVEGSSNLYYTNARADARIGLASIGDLADVTLTSTATGDILRYNGSAFINEPLNLGTDTEGDYVASLVAGTGITLTNNSGETSTPTVSVDMTAFDTDDLTEGSTNLYYTDTRVGSYLTTNSYATESYVDSAVATENEISEMNDVTLTSLASGEFLQYNGTAWVNVVPDTDDITEGTNLFYTNARVDTEIDSYVTGGTGVTVSSGQISIGQAVETTSNVQFADTQIDGDLTTGGQVVHGTNTISINQDADGTDNTLNVEIEFLRGNLQHKHFFWDETNDRFSINSDDLAVGTVIGNLTGNVTGDLTGDVTGTVSDISNHDTDDLSEGLTNLYYTDARARSSISYTDAGGDGSLSYDSSTGTITYTGPSATEVRAHFSAGTGVSISSGEISIGQSVGTSDDVTFNDLILSGNLTVSGTTTTINTETLTLADNVIILNSNATGSASENAGIEVERGDDTNKTLIWNEGTDKWSVGSETFVAGTFEGALTGNVTGTVSDISNHDTDDLTEGSTNLYYTDTRVGTYLTTNSYATQTYVDNAVASENELSEMNDVTLTSSTTGDFLQYNGSAWVNIAPDTDDIAEGTNLYYTTARFDTAFSGKTTDNLTEGSTNLYYTDERAQDALGTALTMGTQTLITVTYQDSTNDFDFVVDNDLANYDNTTSAFTTLADFSGGTNISFSSGTIAFDNSTDLDMGGRKVLFANIYSAEGDLPSASTYHGMFAHVHGTGRAYYAHAGNWVELIGENEIGSGLTYSSGSLSADFTPTSTDTLTNKTINFEDNTPIIEFAVTVSNASGSNKFYLDGELAASIQLIPGVTYRFDLSDGSTSGHPFALSTTQDGTHNSGSSYTTGVTTNGSQGSVGAYLQIVVDAATADTLYYYCTAHSGMANDAVISVQGTSLSASDTDDLAEGSSNLYYTDTRARSAISVTDAGGDGSLSYDNTTGVFTYTGPSASEVRSHFSAGTGVTLSSGEISIGQAVGTSSDVTFNDVTVSGDLTVSGTTTTVNTETIELADNIIVFNSNATGSATENAGIEIERGDDANKTLIWDETSDKWTVGSETFVASTFEGNLTGTVSDISNHDTDDLTEGSTNLYYTTARANTDFDTKLAAADTDDLSEGASNLYYTTARFDTAFSGKGAADLSYDNSDADTLTATNVKGALDELDLAKVDKSTLASTLTFFPTDTADGSISGYYRMVTSISDTDYDTTAVNVSTGNITANDQEVGAVIADADLFTGNPGYINVHVVGSIRNTSGGSAGFYFKVFHRDSSGTETLMGTSSSTSNVTNTTYQEFYADALLNNPQEFTSTDRVVFKWFATNLSGSATYDFRYGGTGPVRGNFPVQTSLIIHDQEAVDVQTDTSAFAGILSTSETTVQAALDVIDDIDTDNVPEGSTNLYYTTSRFDTAFTGKSTTDLSEGTNLYYTQARFDTAFGGKDTDDLSEGSTNLYFTNARADARITAANVNDLNDILFADPTSSDDAKVISYSDTSGGFVLSSLAGLSGSGEVNTASNSNVAGIGVFKQKTGEDLEFRGINAGSTKITVTNDTSNDEIDIDLGTVSIDHLSDVDTTTSAPTSGQALKWSGSQWEPGDASSQVSQLTDVTLTSLATDDLLVYNGTNWVNTTLDTDDVAEGSTNLYYTDARAQASITGGTGISNTSGTIAIDFTEFDTDSITEGSTNLFYTNARVQSYLSGGTGVTLSGSGEFSIGQAVGTTDNVTFNDMTVSGNLTVSGTTTTVNTETINLADNTITLNSNATGSASEDGGIEIERGDDTNKTLIWNETTDKWTVGSETFVAGTFEGEATNIQATAITDLTEDTSPAEGDYLVTYDVSASSLKKVQKSNIAAAVSFSVNDELPLTLADSTSDPIQFTNVGTSATDLDLVLADGTSDPIQIVGTSNSATVFRDGDTDTYIKVEDTTDDDTIKMATAGTERLIIESTGEVKANGKDLAGYSNGVEFSVQQFRLTANQTTTGAGTDITSGWEVPDSTLQANFGNNVSESSGIFTFSKTGFYKVEAVVKGQNGTAGSAHHILYIITSDDNFSTQAPVARAITQEGGNGDTAYTAAVLDITDLTNHKVKFQYFNNSGEIEGDTNQNRTFVTFTRLGDT
jgi:hypothetical protein